MRPKEPHSTGLSLEHEAVIVAFRPHTLLRLDDCLYALQPTSPHLTRSSLLRCLQPFGEAYTYGRQIKTLRGPTPYEAICQT